MFSKFSPHLYRFINNWCLILSSFINNRNEPTFYQNLMLGFSARASVGTILLPMTVVKARYESGKYQYKTVSDGLRTIWRLEGARGLFSGCAATILRDAPYSGIYLMFYSQGKETMKSKLCSLNSSIFFIPSFLLCKVACIASLV